MRRGAALAVPAAQCKPKETLAETAGVLGPVWVQVVLALIEIGSILEAVGLPAESPWRHWFDACLEHMVSVVRPSLAQ